MRTEIATISPRKRPYKGQRYRVSTYSFGGHSTGTHSGDVRLPSPASAAARHHGQPGPGPWGEDLPRAHLDEGGVTVEVPIRHPRGCAPGGGPSALIPESHRARSPGTPSGWSQCRLVGAASSPASPMLPRRAASPRRQVPAAGHVSLERHFRYSAPHHPTPERTPCRRPSTTSPHVSA